MSKIFSFLILFSSVFLIAQNGLIDLSFDPESGANKQIKTIALQPDGKILIGGTFSSFNNVPKNNIARLNPDGSIDNTFIASFDDNSSTDINTLKIQPDGKILIGGYFSKYNGLFKKSIVRINQDGSIDPTFDSNAGFDNAVDAIALQPDGKILVGGEFNKFNQTPINHIIRLNTDGSLDNTFDPGSGPGPGASVGVLAIAVQDDGKIIIGGDFSTYNGIYTQKLVRINSDGSLDHSFLNAAEGLIRTIAIQENGKILIGGDFLGYDGKNKNFFARLNDDGNLDEPFLGGVDRSVYSIKIQADSKILICGDFTYYNGGFLRRAIARALESGSVDPSFDSAESIGIGNGKSITALEQQIDGKIMVAGNFSFFNNVSRNNIARVKNSLLNTFDLSKNEDLLLYPNPVKNYLYLKNIDFPILGFEIYSVEGRKIRSGKNINLDGLNVENLQKGTYLLKLQTKNSLMTSKFIKE